MQRSRTTDEGPVPPPSVAYSAQGGPGMFEPPRNRSLDDGHPLQHQQMSLLQIQELNRRGRISPLPQAVQGAQPQLSGPAGEPGIKSEFGRIFGGVNSGIGGLSSPAPPRTQLPYSGPGLLRRDDTEIQEQGIEAPAKPGRDSARGKRRKLKDDETRDEETSGRQSPAGGRAKRAKNHAHHHHQYVPPYPPPNSIAPSNRVSHHHHHHHHVQEQLSSPADGVNAAFRNVKGSTAMPSPPTGFAKDVHPAHHHHAVPRSTPHNHTQTGNKAGPVQPSQQAVIVPKAKHIVRSQAVLDSVAGLPRKHLGDVPYEVILKPARTMDPRTGRPPRHGYASTPVPLLWDLIKDQLNCTLTVKVGRQHLVPESREEITSRRAVWGTDIYTDDSDIIAACIHAGWIRGEWPEDVDVDMLDLVVPDDTEKRGRRTVPNQATSASANPDVLTEPPKTGPMVVPPNRDLHVTVLILPRLEKYSSTVRFGIKSREFGGKIVDSLGATQRSVHDGLSFMITSLRWVNNGAGTQNRLRGKARRERIRRALREVEQAPLAAAKAMNLETATGTGTVEPSNTPSTGGVELSASWWKTKATPPGERDKENLPDTTTAEVDHDDTVVIDDAQDKDVADPSKEEGTSCEPATKPVEEDPAPGTASDLKMEMTASASAEAAEKVAEEVTKDIIEKIIEQADATEKEGVKDAPEEAITEKTAAEAPTESATEAPEESTEAATVRV